MKKNYKLSLTAIAVGLAGILQLSPVLLPNPLDCASFFMCSNGVPILQKCPEGLHFNAHLNVCDWPQEANCHQAQGFFGDDIYYEGTQKCPAVDPEEPTGNGGAPYSGGNGDGYASGSNDGNNGNGWYSRVYCHKYTSELEDATPLIACFDPYFSDAYCMNYNLMGDPDNRGMCLKK